MGCKCFVDMCKSARYVRKKGDENVEKRHFFSPSTVLMLNSWRKAIPKGDNLQKRSIICDLHFEKEDVLTEFVTKMPDGTEVRIKRDRATLRKDAVPKIFPETICHPAICLKKDKDVKKRREEFLQSNGKESDFSKIYSQANLIPLPSAYWFVNSLPLFIQWSSWSENLEDCSKKIIVRMDKSVTIVVNEKEAKLKDFEKVHNVTDIVKLLQEVEELVPCVRGGLPQSENCTGYVVRKTKGTPGRQGTTCTECLNLRKIMRFNSTKVDFRTRTKTVNNKWREKYKVEKRREKGLVRKGKVLKTTIGTLQRQCATRNEEIINGAIAMLSEKEQLAVRTCFEASKVKSRRGMRYSRQWLYECILLRIKSKKAYKHLRKHKVLVLPSTITLEKCMKLNWTSYWIQATWMTLLRLPLLKSIMTIHIQNHLHTQLLIWLDTLLAKQQAGLRNT